MAASHQSTLTDSPFAQRIVPTACQKLFETAGHQSTPTLRAIAPKMPPKKQSPVPLPPNEYLEPGIGKAYDKCLALEKRMGWSTPQGEHAVPPCLAARILGHALRLAPCDSGRNWLTREILDCKDDDDFNLKNLADLYLDSLIRVFRNPKSKTPVISSDHSPLLSDEDPENMTYLLEKPTRNSQWLRKVVMFRDEHRCVFTGALDFTEYENDPTVCRFGETAVLQLVHIFGQSMSDNTKDGSEAAAGEKVDWASTVGGVLELFGGFSLRKMFGDENVQNPLNAFMASVLVCQMFESLKLWLVPAQDKDQQVLSDTYDVKSSVVPEDEMGLGSIKSQITFKARQVENKSAKTVTPAIIPPPDPRLLAVHAACAQIVHMSGAAEYMDEIFRDDDDSEISVMTQPGAAYELTRALRRAKVMRTV